MKSLFGSKSGQASNYIALVLFLFLFGFFSILGFVLTNNIVQGFFNAGFNDGIFLQVGNDFLNALRLFDYIIILIMAALLISIGITSYKLNTSPMFFIVTLITAAMTGAVSFFFNYMFIEMAGADAFATALVFFPRTIIICTNLHWVSLIALVIGSITLYGKKETPSLAQP